MTSKDSSKFASPEEAAAAAQFNKTGEVIEQSKPYDIWDFAKRFKEVRAKFKEDDRPENRKAFNESGNTRPDARFVAEEIRQNPKELWKIMGMVEDCWIKGNEGNPNAEFNNGWALGLLKNCILAETVDPGSIDRKSE